MSAAAAAHMFVFYVPACILDSFFFRRWFRLLVSAFLFVTKQGQCYCKLLEYSSWIVGTFHNSWAQGITEYDSQVVSALHMFSCKLPFVVVMLLLLLLSPSLLWITGSWKRWTVAPELEFSVVVFFFLSFFVPQVLHHQQVCAPVSSCGSAFGATSCAPTTLNNFLALFTAKVILKVKQNSDDFFSYELYNYWLENQLQQWVIFSTFGFQIKHKVVSSTKQQ